jgi:ActR/RegA family two-component response regulator
MAATTILILEDDCEVAGVFARALRADGCDVTVCVGFEDARESLARSVPDAVLTDVRVGPYNGLQLAHLFRQKSPDGRVVVVTGFDDAMIRREVGWLNGEYLVKPVTVRDVRAALRLARHPALH